MTKIILRISILVTILASVTLVSWISRNEALGNKKLGLFGSTINELSQFPDLFQETVVEVSSHPLTYLKTPEAFKTVNKLSKDLHVLTSYSTSNSDRRVEIRNLRNDSTIFTWDIAANFAKSHHRILNALPLENRELCYAWETTSGLRKIDSTGSEIWKNDQVIVHHSYKLDADTNIWACTYSIDSIGSFVLKGEYSYDYTPIKFLDNSITAFDPKNGKIVYHKSVAEIFLENGLEEIVTSSANNSDPFHLNDIEICSKDGLFMKKGDVFLSFRNISTLVQYRPSNNKVIRHIRGNFSVQHDVDIIDQKTILFFNNNSSIFSDKSCEEVHAGVAKNVVNFGKVFSNLKYWNLEKNEILSAGFDSLMVENEIFTYTEGLVEKLDDYDYFIEEQNSGILWVLGRENVKYKSVLDTEINGYHHLSNWTRIVKYE